MRFDWDENKDRQNFLKHGIRFEVAKLVFNDPFALSHIDDASNNEERWITIGIIGRGSVLVVIHTWLYEAAGEVIRIISARAAAAHERRVYAEAYQGSKARDRTNRNKDRRRH